MPKLTSFLTALFGCSFATSEATPGKFILVDVPVPRESIKRVTARPIQMVSSENLSNLTKLDILFEVRRKYYDSWSANSAATLCYERFFLGTREWWEHEKWEILFAREGTEAALLVIYTGDPLKRNELEQLVSIELACLDIPNHDLSRVGDYDVSDKDWNFIERQEKTSCIVSLCTIIE